MDDSKYELTNLTVQFTITNLEGRYAFLISLSVTADPIMIRVQAVDSNPRCLVLGQNDKTKVTFYMSPQNQFHFLYMYLLFYFLISRKPEFNIVKLIQKIGHVLVSDIQLLVDGLYKLLKSNLKRFDIACLKTWGLTCQNKEDSMSNLYTQICLSNTLNVIMYSMLRDCPYMSTYRFDHSETR